MFISSRIEESEETHVLRSLCLSLTRPSIAVYNCGPRSNSRRAESNSDRRSREQAGNGWPESVVCRIRFRRYPLGIPLKTDIVLRECTGGHRVNARLGSLNCAINSGRKLTPDAKSCLRAADFEIHRHVADTRNPEYLNRMGRIIAHRRTCTICLRYLLMTPAICFGHPCIVYIPRTRAGGDMDARTPRAKVKRILVTFSRYDVFASKIETIFPRRKYRSV